MALAMDAFPPITPADVTLPLLVTLHSTHKHSLLSCPRFRSDIAPAALARSREWCSLATLRTSLAHAAEANPASRRFDICSRASSLASITDWPRCCLAILLHRRQNHAFRDKIASSFPPWAGDGVAQIQLVSPASMSCQNAACTADGRGPPPPRARRQKVITERHASA